MLMLRKIVRSFGKRYTHEDPKFYARSIKKVYPPPGENLKLPDWTVEKYLQKIGMGAIEHIDSFETLEDIFKITSVLQL